MENFDPNSTESFYQQLILQELEGNISSDNAAILLEWRNADPANEQWYHQVVESEEELHLLKVYGSLDANISLAALHGKMQGRPNQIRKLRLKVVRWIAIAAMLAVICTGGLYLIGDNEDVVLQTSPTQTASFLLPDGSKVFLNGNTRVSFNKADFNISRQIAIKSGECFLNVVHNPAKPFSISYKEITITDIGTSFNVGVNEQQLKVEVSSGEVSVEAVNRGEKVSLVEGEMIAYGISTQKIKKSKIQDPNYRAYVDHHIYFNATPVAQAVVLLEKLYHRKLIISGKQLGSKHFTAEFNDRPLDEILQVMSKALQLNVVEKGKIIYLQEKPVANH